MKSISLSDLLKILELSGDDYTSSQSMVLKGILPIDKATKGSLTFITDEKYAAELDKCQASALLTAKKYENFSGLQIVHTNPYWAFAKAAQYFYEADHGEEQVHERAFVHPSATVGAEARIFPSAYVGENAVVGERVTLYPGSYLGKGAVVGDDTVIYANAVLEHGCKIGRSCIIHAGTVIGADGFGFAPKPPNKDKNDSGEIAKIPQVGDVVIDDHVEIGALCTIDRGAMGSTKIGSGTKLDDKVHVGHNCIIGQNTIICGMVALAGSAKIGNWVTIAGNAAVNGHISIADGVTIGGKAGVTKSIKEPGGVYLGFPAYPAKEWKKHQIFMRRLVREKSKKST